MEPDWDSLEVTVERIANGFLVTERKRANYATAASERLFYPNMETIERELVIRLRAAATLDMKKAEENF
jgi:hypothetical protein